MTQTLLAIENLSVGFRHQQTVRTVVNDVSLQIEAGETLALVGESGSGKSVTALSILRVLPSRRLNISPAIFVFMANRCFMPAIKRCAVYAVIRSP
ncbi:ABC transporter ATP-binding protein [Escherichia coli]|nr:ABC transporter ATP-binding protein [Escherichia coli]